MRIIGLIGGMSWESSAEYYRLINQAVRERLGNLHSAEIVMVSVDFGPIALAQRDGRWDDAATRLEDAARQLQAAGAGCVVVCTNTMHKLAARVAAAVTIPLLHIADPVGDAARRAGWRTLGLLGTAFTMEQDFLRERLLERHGVAVLTPDAPQRADIHRIIYDELCNGVISDASRQVYRTVIADLAARGAQAVILGCTEITLLIKAADVDIPVLDTTALHAGAAVDFALQT